MSRVWLGACGWSIVFGLPAGCTSEAPGTIWRIALAGQTVGQERRVPTPNGWTSHREYSMLLGDEEVSFEASSEWSLVGDDVVAWRSGDTHIVLDEPLPHNLFVRPIPGPGRVFDPSARRVRSGEFAVDGDLFSFSDGDVHWWVELQDGEAVAFGADSIRVSRQEEPVVDWERIDPAKVLGLAGATALESPGHLFARIRVDGGVREVVEHQAGVVEIRLPLWEEIPNTELKPGPVPTSPLAAQLASRLQGQGRRDSIASLVDQVRHAIRYRPTPLPDPRAAIHGASGDCTEHVDLFTDVAMALGMETRPVVGWVALPSGNWIPHAWAVVVVPGFGDVPVDPTLGERIATPLHLPLAPRFQDRPWEGLGKAVGSSVEVVETR